MEDTSDSIDRGEYLDWMCINLRKLEEDASRATYLFSCGRFRETEGGRSEHIGGAEGRVRIDKKDGNVTLLDAMPGDSEKRVASRTAQALKRHWAKGEFPETTAHVAG